MTILWSFDPGVTTGVVTLNIDDALKPIRLENLSEPKLFDLLASISKDEIPNLVIIEEYKIFPNKFTTHAHSNVPALQVVGAIRYWASEFTTQVIMQPPSIKSMGYKYLGVLPPKDHSYSHFMDAYAHAIYYLVIKKIIPNPALKKIRETREDKSNA